MTARGSWGSRPFQAAGALLAIALGLPGCTGLALGLAPRDWPVPFSTQLAGDFALRTVLYLSGFLFSFGLIRLVRLTAGLVAAANPRVEWSVPAPPEAAPTGASPGSSHPRVPSAPVPGHEHVSLSEPFYGFLPGSVQNRLARQTGYQALLYTKISILLTAGAGVLLAGSWEPVSELEPVPREAAARIGAGLYLAAESVSRYISFSRGEPTGSLIGSLLYGAAASLRRVRRP